jgi:hemerythrin-like domain-containing protein
MITYAELNEQNHRITELTNVLNYLFKDRAMCDTGSCCDLFYRYVDLVREHIEMVDKDMYSDLLKSPDKKINNVARNFMSGSVEIKRILKDFTKRWCPMKKKDTLLIKEHALFMKDTEELFEIVLQRILDETEHLYPLVRSLSK